MVFVAVALDDSAEDVAEFATDIELPVLLDRHHVLSETLAVSNVPTVVWVDEADRIVVPNWVAFSNDLFTDFHGMKSGPALDAIRAKLMSGGPDFADAEIDKIFAQWVEPATDAGVAAAR